MSATRVIVREQKRGPRATGTLAALQSPVDAGGPGIFISVVIPVYLAEGCLHALCERLANVLADIGPYEVILVEDRSPDLSWRAASEIAREFDNIIAVRLSRNFGQHYAITAGMDLVRGEWAVVMDCDLQDRPEEIPRLLARARAGCDIVLARRLQKQHGGMKRLCSRVFYRVFNLLSGYQIDHSVGSFRIMRRCVIDAYRNMGESARLFGGLIEWLGFETGYVDVEHAPRFAGRSSYNLKKLVLLAVDGMISFSNRPLYLSIGLGALFSALSAGYGSYLLIGYFVYPHVGVPGWLSTMTALSFLTGILLLNLGVLGIYIGRIYEETKGRPLYIIDSIVVSKSLTPPGEKT